MTTTITTDSSLENLQEQAEEANLSLGEIVESINGKADIDPQNTPFSSADYVTEWGGDSEKWYRKWKSNWIEQGGYTLEQGDMTVYNISFLKNYDGSKYTILLTQVGGPEGNFSNGCTVRNKQGSFFEAVNRSGGLTRFQWYTAGYGA